MKKVSKNATWQDLIQASENSASDFSGNDYTWKTFASCEGKIISEKISFNQNCGCRKVFALCDALGQLFTKLFLRSFWGFPIMPANTTGKKN